MSEVARRYFERVLGHVLEQSRPVPLSAREVAEALWPINEAISRTHAQTRTLRYEPHFESDADAAIEADPAAERWADLPLGVQRVLLERQSQMLAVAMANEQAGNDALTFIPHDLSDGHRTPAVALLFLHGMKLPWPAADRSRDSGQTGSPPGSGRPH